MSHLSAEQISNWIVAGRSQPADRQVEQHVRDCPECRQELLRLEETLSQFGGSVRAWSDRQGAAALPVAWKPPRPQPLRWVLVLGALFVLATVPVYRTAMDRRQAEQARSDAILLEQVDAALSRTVPAPMEPLARLVSWHPEKGNPEKGENQ
jgi:hypothetical protein